MDTHTAETRAAAHKLYGLMRWYARRYTDSHSVTDVAHDAAVIFLTKFEPGRSGAYGFVRRVVQTAAGHLRKHRHVRRDQRARLHDTMPAPEPEPLFRDDERDALYCALARLDARARTVVVLRFGLSDTPPLTCRAVAQRVGLTKQRVSQIEAAALADLHTFLTPARKEFSRG